MKKKQGFYDLRISGNRSIDYLSVFCDKLVEYGYRTIAIDLVLQESVFRRTDDETQTSKKHKLDHSLPEPSWIIPPPANIDFLKQKFHNKLTILHRLTIHFSGVQQLHQLAKEPHLSSYALLAVVPLTEMAFQAACSFPWVDLISFDPAKPMGRVSRKHYYVAVERGVYFEVMYGAAVGDAIQRRNTICQAHLYHSFGKSRNIVVTSGAETPGILRGPYDVINLGLIFGLSEEQSKAALTNTCRSLLIDAEARRSGRSAVLVELSHPYRKEIDRFQPAKKDVDQSRPAKLPKLEPEVESQA